MRRAAFPSPTCAISMQDHLICLASCFFCCWHCHILSLCWSRVPCLQLLMRAFAGPSLAKLLLSYSLYMGRVAFWLCLTVYNMLSIVLLAIAAVAVATPLPAPIAYPVSFDDRSPARELLLKRGDGAVPSFPRSSISFAQKASLT